MKKMLSGNHSNKRVPILPRFLLSRSKVKPALLSRMIVTCKNSAPSVTSTTYFLFVMKSRLVLAEQASCSVLNGAALNLTWSYLERPSLAACILSPVCWAGAT